MYHTCGARTEVTDSRPMDGYVYRRHYCEKCDVKFSTYEISKEEYNSRVGYLSKEDCNKLQRLLSAYKALMNSSILDKLDDMEDLDAKFRK